MSVFTGITYYCESHIELFPLNAFQCENGTLDIWVKGKGLNASIGLSMKSACGLGSNVGHGQQFGYSF